MRAGRNQMPPPSLSLRDPLRQGFSFGVSITGRGSDPAGAGG